MSHISFSVEPEGNDIICMYMCRSWHKKILHLLLVYLHYEPSCPTVGWIVGPSLHVGRSDVRMVSWFVIISKKGREVTLLINPMGVFVVKV